MKSSESDLHVQDHLDNDWPTGRTLQRDKVVPVSRTLLIAIGAVVFVAITLAVFYWTSNGSARPTAIAAPAGDPRLFTQKDVDQLLRLERIDANNDRALKK